MMIGTPGACEHLIKRASWGDEYYYLDTGEEYVSDYIRKYTLKGMDIDPFIEDSIEGIIGYSTAMSKSSREEILEIVKQLIEKRKQNTK